MGITGLIPFLEKASTPVNIKQLEESSVAVDSYCWLHKGVFACAEKLIRGESTNIHILYCLKYVDMLLRHKIRVIMVFDGRHLPAKAETERRRREARDESKQLAKECLRRNDIEKARSHMRRAVDVTHEMALELIKACRSRGVDCIVAPYEADAQMAWLNNQGLVEYVVTEDSDLTLFGAQKILFKLDLTGQALLVENTKLYLTMGCKPEKYTFDKFRRMCILSGCDYLDSLQGIGLKKACKFILYTEEDDMRKALKKMPSYLKMSQLNVTNEYIESFLKAEATFKHMYIYNPLERRMERLHELEEFQTNEDYCSNAGSLLTNSEKAFQLAIGNLNPFTMKQLDDWHPNRTQVKSKYQSIWQNSKFPQAVVELNDSTHSKKDTGSVFYFKKIEFKNTAEMVIEEKLSEEKSKLEESEIFSMYKYAPQKVEQKRKRRHSSSSSCEEETDQRLDLGRTLYSHNPFAKTNTLLESLKKSPVCSNNSLLKALSPRKINQENYNQPIKTPKTTSVKSRFFSENIKQAVKKSFAARDLTSEMYKIEEKAITYVQQQQDLYNCSLQSPKRKIEEKDENMFQKHLPDSNNPNNDVKNITYTKEFLTSEIGTLNTPLLEEDIILLSDVEDQYYQKSSMLPSVQTLTSTTQKSETIIPRMKNKKVTIHRKLTKTLKSVDTKQSRLSMFGFQKKPSLKK